MPMTAIRKSRFMTFLLVIVPVSCVGAIEAAETSSAASTPEVEGLGVSGGLCVEVGCGEPELALRLGRTGRFLVQSLDTRADAVAAMRSAVEAQGMYGLVSVLRPESAEKLPYAENLVNLAVLRNCPHAQTPLAEVVRVVAPGGMLLAAPGRASEAALREVGLEDVRAVAGQWHAARKPRPAGMGDWTHAWHAADGNTVSQDELVGPPRRVRWIAGPEEEIGSMVTAAGRNFYGGVWARDAFNGLRLWQQDLKPSPAQGGFGFRYTPGSVKPVAVGDRLLVLTDGVVCALDGASGRKLREYPEAGRPNTLLHVDGKLLAVDAQGLRAVEADSGRLVWKHEAPGPRYTAATPQSVFFLHAGPRPGENPAAVCLDLASGTVRWTKTGEPWLPLVRRLVAHEDLVVFEVSTIADKKEGNAIHVASAADGKLLWSRRYVPGMNHMKQARAMFIGDWLWVLEHLQGVALDPKTGEVRKRVPAGLCHCFPPVATPRFLFSGEMDLTDLDVGQRDAHQITKASCGRDFGWIPANGLIYNSPKHCVCWPMLRGYTALAPESPSNQVREVVANRRFHIEKGCDPPAAPPADPADWPCYRHDPARSSATKSSLPGQMKTLWSADLSRLPQGTVVQDWRENPFVRGPITAPVAAAGLVCVARPDAHQVVALDLRTGQVRWRFTADGRVDTPPTLHRGLCLFGDHAGSVWCLRADDGRMVWRLRAAPSGEQIVAYGQVESPWPVAGSVLVVNDTVYFAAGRHPLADGGILLFAAEPATGKLHWVQRLDKLPMKDFYACVGMEFDNIDLLQQEGDRLAMSRWLFDLATGRMTVKAEEPFARPGTDRCSVVAQRGLWTYAPRNMIRFNKLETLPRPLAAFSANVLVGCLPDQRSVFRRDFDPEDVATFNAKWMTGWDAGENFRKKTGDVWPVDRIVKETKWTAPLLRDAPLDARIAAMLIAGDRLATAATGGGLQVVSLADGSVVGRADLPPPLWDGLAAASGRLLVSTAEGRVVCLGRP